jgi:hypothetical protein
LRKRIGRWFGSCKGSMGWIASQTLFASSFEKRLRRKAMYQVRPLHESDLPTLPVYPQQGQRSRVSLPEVPLDLSPRWSWQHQHPAKVSGSWPSSWRYGTAHQHPPGCWCSSHGESVRARKRLCGQPHRSRASLEAAQCHSKHPICYSRW